LHCIVILFGIPKKLPIKGKESYQETRELVFCSLSQSLANYGSIFSSEDITILLDSRQKGYTRWSHPDPSKSSQILLFLLRPCLPVWSPKGKEQQHILSPLKKISAPTISNHSFTSSYSGKVNEMTLRACAMSCWQVTITTPTLIQMPAPLHGDTPKMPGFCFMTMTLAKVNWSKTHPDLSQSSSLPWELWSRVSLTRNQNYNTIS
jgi:hypothetical protein